MSNPVVPSGTGIPPQNYGNPVPGNFYVGQWTWYGSPHNNWYWAGNGPVGWIGGPYSFTQVPKPTKDPYGNPIQPPATTSPPTPAPVPPPPPPPPPAAGVPPTETPPQPPAPPSASAPPEEGCGQPLAVAVGPVQDMLGGKKLDEQMSAPVVGNFHCLPIHSRDRWVNSATNANQFVLYDDPPFVKKDEFGRYTSVHSGYGDGVVAFSPPQLFDHHLYGDGYLLDSLWPKTISEPTLMLINGNRGTSAHGDHARSYLAFGLPIPTTNKPKSGVYFEYDPATGVLNIQHTDSTGGDTTVANGVTIDGSPIGSGSVTFPLEAPDNATGAQYAFDAGTVVGSDLAGMGFDQNVQEGPAFYDINGDNQLYITSAGVTIPGKLTVTGLIDPTGLELTPVAANPGGVAANTLWLDSGDSNRLKHGSHRVMLGSNNLSEVTNAATARSNIGAGDVSLTGIFVTGNLVKSTSGGDIEDAGFAPASVYRSGGTDVAIADGGTGASDADGAINNIVSAATNRTPALADRFPFEVASHASQAGAATFQQALNLIGSLTAETTLDPANDKLALYDSSGTATDSMTPQAFMNGMQNLAQATSATRNFKLLALDASNVAKHVNLDDLDPTGQILICRTVSYTGSGSSGKTVTLTGINRVYAMLVMKQATGASANVALYLPLGATGSITHNDLANATGYTEDSLNAPAAGTDQVLTINTTHGSRNASGTTYHVVVWGTPT